MTTPINGTAGTSIAASYTGPADGETIDAADVNSPFLAIANDMATIKSGDVTLSGAKTFDGDVAITGDITVSGDLEVVGDASFPGGVSGDVTVGGGDVYSPHYYFATAISVTRTGQTQPVKQGGSWAMAGTSQWTDSSTTGILNIPVDVPHNCVLQTVRIYIHPAAGHGGIPTVSFALFKRVLSTDVSTKPAQTGGSDPSASVAAYEAVHALTLTLTGGHTVDRSTSRYYLELTGEGGGFALADLVYVGVEYDYDVTSVGVD